MLRIITLYKCTCIDTVLLLHAKPHPITSTFKLIRGNEIKHVLKTFHTESIYLDICLNLPKNKIMYVCFKRDNIVCICWSNISKKSLSNVSENIRRSSIHRSILLDAPFVCSMS